MGAPSATDVVIAGGGIIGLSVGLELRRRGFSVVVLERRRVMRSASWAAGGMLAAHDPENPIDLLPLSLHSLALYPEYLERIVVSSGHAIALRTRRTLQQTAPTRAKTDFDFEEAALEDIQQWIPGFASADRGDKFVWLREESLDPRDLCRALPAAFLAEQGRLLEETAVLGVESSASGVVVHTANENIQAGAFVNCCGAWAGKPRLGGLPVGPVKGHAVTVALAPERLRCVLRTPEFYAIPRGDGRVTIGATIERVGFDETVEPHRIDELLQQSAAALLPEVQGAQRLESWAGLRPGTPDDLPILGAGAAEHCWHATGHYRNGVLLAPVTARLLAQSICDESPDMPMEKFSPSRFELSDTRSSA